jgi:pyridoxamine 5'-phosphate oxidase
METRLELADPIELFSLWLKEAEASEPNDANAAALATATPQGAPSVRMVLVKRADRRGFCFYTNWDSKKGMQLRANPKAALCFHWKSLRRQVRIEGAVTEMEAADVDAYFHSRSRNSQIGAAVSEQSRSLESREELEARFQRFAQQHPGGSTARTGCTTGSCLPAMVVNGRARGYSLEAMSIIPALAPLIHG